MKSTLLLNASYEPLSVISAQRAVTLIVQGKASILDESPAFFNSAHGKINVPYVAILNRQVKQKTHRKPPRFSRRGVLVRDSYTCAYCKKYGDTIDHVVPRSAGGSTTYENCVASCGPCNRKKSNKTLKEIGWTIDQSFSLKAPTVYETLLNKVKNTGEAYATWNKYVQYYVPQKR